MSDACKIANCNFTFHGFIHISEKNPDAVYTGADPGFLEGGFKFTKGVRFVKSSCTVARAYQTNVLLDRGHS